MNTGDNIAMGDDLTDPGVRQAVEHAAAGADHIIATLPRGLDTLLDKRFDGGQELSGDNGNASRRHAGSTATLPC
jgi:ATP-binding cassette, subfamily B, bacterial